MNFDCKWPDESAYPIDVRNSRDERHLRDDVEVAEELAIRYTDQRIGRRPLNVAGILVRTGGGNSELNNRESLRDDCQAKLFSAVADAHGVSLEDVAASRSGLVEKHPIAEALVILPLPVLYTVVALTAIRRVHDRFPPDEPWAAAITVLFVSIPLTVLVLALGAVFAGVLEVVRLGNEHVSLRGLRPYWPQRHWRELLALGVVAFWIAAVIHYRTQSPSGQSG